MKLSILTFALLIISAIVIGAMPPAVQDQGDVRGAFLTSRPKEKTESTATAPPRTSRRRPRPVPGPKNPKTTPSPTPTTSPGPIVVGTGRVNASRIGLGLTLFARDSNGLAVRVDPAHVFHKGDRVRVLLETNTDGYLYIFNTTDDGAPVMIYPDPQLDEAGNYLQAHVPFEIPSSMATEERLRWLVFDEHAGNERLYFVFSRDPLPGVPIEDDLISFCRTANPTCPWRPVPQVWSQVRFQMNQPVQTDKVAKFNKAQTDSEHQATTRGIGLSTSDPEPTMIMMVASSDTSTLVTTLDLVHK